MRRLVVTLVTATVALLAHATPASAQFGGLPLPRPHLDWRTSESRHFVFHYPASMREWTLAVAPRMDDIHGAVRDIVGYAPTRKVHVIVEDPLAESNGSAWPVVPAPNIYLWPTPPEPTSAIGNNRTWGEILGVHEFAHIAHLVRPSRQRFYRLRSPVGQLGISPVAVKSPRWMTEGYATFVEGRLTGHGRPHGVWRPAILRQFAREGRMPSYMGLNATDGFYQGSLAYLAGSAYIEWLAAKHGDSSLVHVWRRLTAKRERTFDEAFAGVYGAPPAQLYGRFVAELTENAMDAEEVIGGADTASAGVTVQRYQWYTGEPALSPDGRHVALAVADRRTPTRVLVLKTEPDTMSDRERRQRRRMLERDPQDVAAVEVLPRARKPVATLWPRYGSAFGRPRWFRDSERILLSHRDGRPDGSLRPDLWIWNYRTRKLSRVTRGAAIRAADPSPDGTQAAGVRCLDGDCDLVLADLRNGAVRTLVKGSPVASWYKPRWSPDGTTIAAAVQRAGTWRVATVDARSGAVTEVFTDAVNRYDASWTPDGRALVYVSERSGVPNVERIDLATRTVTPVTRVIGAATAPEVEPSGRGIWFLSLYARGMDLKRIVPESTVVAAPPRLDLALAPAAAVGVQRADTFATSTLTAERAYGVGPRRHLLLPIALGATEGRLVGLSLAGTDPVGRLTWTLSGGWGLDYREPGNTTEEVLNGLFASEGMWRGGSLRAAWRRWRPTLEGDAWWTEHRPGHQRVGLPALRAATAGLDHRQAGARLGGSLERSFGWRTHTYRAGLAMSRLEFTRGDTDAEDRRLAYAELGGAYRVARKRGYVAARWHAHGSGGTTIESDWKRAIVRAGIGAGGPEGGIALDATWGRAYDANGFEQFLVGGVEPPFLDASVMSQRIAVPALPVGLLGGARVATWRVSIGGDLLSPFLMGIAAGDRLPDVGDILEDSYRIVGAESNLRIPSVGLVRTPGASVLLGAAYMLDDPLRKRVRGYAGVTFRP